MIGGDAPSGTLSFEAEFAKASPGPMIDTSDDETAFWLYSSGSTGTPKGVLHAHGSMKATADTYGAQVLGIEESDVVHSVAKIFFAYGLGNAITFPMAVGATTILNPGPPHARGRHGHPRPPQANDLLRGPHALRCFRRASGICRSARREASPLHISR